MRNSIRSNHEKRRFAQAALLAPALMLAAMDTDGDGQVSKAEYLARAMKGRQG